MIDVVLLALGLLIGYPLPDLDLAPVLPLRHRSWLTHGAWLPLGVWWLALQYPEWRLLFLGLLCGLALHLLYDSAPKSWRGSAMVNLFPLPFSLPAWLSVVYIFSAACVALYAVTAL